MQLRIMFVFAALSACASRPSQPAGETKPKSEAPPPAAASDRDSNRTGVPSGYVGRTEEEEGRIDDVRYRGIGNGWAITTGPAHIVYSPGDTMRGGFIIASTFNQKEIDHPAAFGLFMGGSELGQPSRQYTYFMVRGSGQYSVQVRDGTATREIIPWTAFQVVGTQTAEWRVRHRLAIRVRGDSVHFFHNGNPVAAVKVGTVPTDGIAGFRLDRNVRVTVERLRSTT